MILDHFRQDLNELDYAIRFNIAMAETGLPEDPDGEAIHDDVNLEGVVNMLEETAGWLTRYSYAIGMGRVVRDDGAAYEPHNAKVKRITYANVAEMLTGRSGRHANLYPFISEQVPEPSFQLALALQTLVYAAERLDELSDMIIHNVE